MYRRALLASLILTALALGAASALAAPTTYRIDSAHSQVGFSIRHFFTKVSGRFTSFAGTIVYDPQDLTASGVQAEIETASINTDQPNRDKHLRSADFFAADSFPKLTFTSKSVTPAGASSFVVSGDLTMRGVTRPVNLQVNFLGSGPTQPGVTRAGFEASTRVNRKDYDINWNRVLDNGGVMLGDDVDITLNIEGMTPPPAQKP